jgi:hypothetical protein
MRNGAVAIFPLLLAVSLLFWFIWFLGGASDTLHEVTNVENLQHTQERLIIAALKKKQELHDANPDFTEEELNEKVNQYIHDIMVLNNIDDE